MEIERQKVRVPWYRSPVPREQLSKLNQRSDFKGFLQTGGYLGLLAATATAAVYGTGRWPWYAVVGILFFHGTCWGFMINGFHELVHDSVFKTKSLNGFFLRIFSFLGWYNHHYFWASHMEHHKFTLHPPDDLEVTLPMPFTLWGFSRSAVINPLGCWNTVKDTVRIACGRLRGEWELSLFPKEDLARRRQLMNWSRLVLAGQAAIVIVSVMMHWWMLPVVTTLAPFYGKWLFFLCNNTQHAGLQDNVPDFRLCCRTMSLNPFVQFLYWHMNFHTEHHMYAAVPCYNLGKLHKIIRADLPECPRGLYAAWKQILTIQRRQKDRVSTEHHGPEK